MEDIVESIAYLTSPDGRKFQVLNSDKTDWDEEATVALYKKELNIK